MIHYTSLSRNPLQKIFWAVGLFWILILLGTAGYMWIENYSFIDALYMTVISVCTVGYGILGKEELSDIGKLFTISLLLASAVIFIFSITTVTSFVVEGQLRQFLNAYRFRKKMNQLENHIIICGLGRSGRECAQELVRQNQTFIGIDQNREIVEDFLVNFPKHFVGLVGDATSEEALQSANIQKAKGLISALPNDAENVFITLTARGINANLEIISRAEHDYNVPKLMRAGATHVILPNMIGGRRMVNMLTRPGLIEFVELIAGENDSDIHVETVDCVLYPKLWGKTLSELHVRSQTGLLVVGRKKENQKIKLNPHPSIVVGKTDKLFLIGAKSDLAKLDEFLKKR